VFCRETWLHLSCLGCLDAWVVLLADNRHPAPAVDGSPHDYTQLYISN
jgi:hypothetical protein